VWKLNALAIYRYRSGFPIIARVVPLNKLPSIELIRIRGHKVDFTNSDHGVISPEPPAIEVPAEVLFVDLAGTLIQTDLLHESLLILSRQ
jgi:hypothetical protein